MWVKLDNEVRSYGTFGHLIHKVLNQFLMDVRSSIVFGGSNVVKLGCTGGRVVAVIYIKPDARYSTRTIGLLINEERSPKKAGKVILFRYSSNGKCEDYITDGCSCRDDTLEQTCIYKQLLNGEDCVLNIVNEVLRVQAPIDDKAPVSGVISIPSIGSEKYVYWVWYNRRSRSRILSSIAVSY